VRSIVAEDATESAINVHRASAVILPVESVEAGVSNEPGMWPIRVPGCKRLVLLCIRFELGRDEGRPYQTIW
jgi:hypothetical protein